MIGKRVRSEADFALGSESTFLGAPLGGWGAGCEGGNEQRSASRPQSDSTGGRGKKQTRWRRSRDRTRPGCGVACRPASNTRGAADRKQAGGARHSIRYAKPRGLRPGPLRFCITHVMLNATRLPPAGTQWAWPGWAAQSVRRMRTASSTRSTLSVPPRLKKARCSISRYRSRAGGLRVPASRMTGVLMCGGERSPRC